MILDLRGRIQKFPDWPPGARTTNITALCHKMQFYRYFVSKSSEFCRHNPLCCFWRIVRCCKRIFRYRLSPETFGYTLVQEFDGQCPWRKVSYCMSSFGPSVTTLNTESDVQKRASWLQSCRIHSCRR